MSCLEDFNYQISGNASGHKLVFLHGVMGSAANWTRLVPYFEADFEVLRFDQRGHGRSLKPADGYHPRDFARDLKDILDELKWEQIALVGHSMGGRNALEFSAHYPDRLSAFVLEDIGPDSSFKAIENIERLLDLVPTPFRSREDVKAFFATYPQTIAWYPNPETVAKFLHSNIELKPDGTQDWRFAKTAIFKSLREGRNEDRWDQWLNLRPPTLVVRGAHSNDLTPATLARMRQLRPQTEVVEIQNAGHWVHFDQPQPFVAALKAFFRRVLGTNL